MGVLAATPWERKELRHQDSQRKRQRSLRDHRLQEKLFFKITIGFFDFALSTRIKPGERTRYFMISFDKPVLVSEVNRAIGNALLDHSLEYFMEGPNHGKDL